MNNRIVFNNLRVEKYWLQIPMQSFAIIKFSFVLLIILQVACATRSDAPKDLVGERPVLDQALAVQNVIAIRYVSSIRASDYTSARFAFTSQPLSYVPMSPGMASELTTVAKKAISTNTIVKKTHSNFINPNSLSDTIVKTNYYAPKIYQALKAEFEALGSEIEIFLEPVELYKDSSGRWQYNLGFFPPARTLTICFTAYVDPVSGTSNTGVASTVGRRLFPLVTVWDSLHPLEPTSTVTAISYPRIVTEKLIDIEEWKPKIYGYSPPDMRGILNNNSTAVWYELPGIRITQKRPLEPGYTLMMPYNSWKYEEDPDGLEWRNKAEPYSFAVVDAIKTSSNSLPVQIAEYMKQYKGQGKELLYLESQELGVEFIKVENQFLKLRSQQLYEFTENSEWADSIQSMLDAEESAIQKTNTASVVGLIAGVAALGLTAAGSAFIPIPTISQQMEASIESIAKQLVSSTNPRIESASEFSLNFGGTERKISASSLSELRSNFQLIYDELANKDV